MDMVGLEFMVYILGGKENGIVLDFGFIFLVLFQCS